MTIDEWIKKMWYIHTMEYYSAVKRNEARSFIETWAGLQSVKHCEVRKKEKNKYYILMCICGIKKMVQMNLFARQEQRQRHKEQTYGHRVGEEERWHDLGDWD